MTTNSRGRINAVKKAQIIYFVCFMLGVFGQGFGQQVEASRTPPRKFEHRGKIQSRYDAATNKTQVVLNPYNVEMVDTAEVRANWQYFSSVIA